MTHFLTRMYLTAVVTTAHTRARELTLVAREIMLFLTTRTLERSHNIAARTLSHVTLQFADMILSALCRLVATHLSTRKGTVTAALSTGAATTATINGDCDVAWRTRSWVAESGADVVTGTYPLAGSRAGVRHIDVAELRVLLSQTETFIGR